MTRTMTGTMTWYAIRSKRTTAFIVAAIITGWAMVRTADSATTRSHSDAVTFSRLADIPSHNGIYRASLIAAPSGAWRHQRDSWTLEVRTANGTPMTNTSLALESGMPDEARAITARPRVTELAGGRYRVDGLRLERSGWWNVRLAISASAGTDSLAFNLVRR